TLAWPAVAGSTKNACEVSQFDRGACRGGVARASGTPRAFLVRKPGRGGIMTRSTGPESANDSAHISFLSSLYCPGCDRERDPLREILTVHWCDAHRPRSDGVDDRRTTLGRRELSAFPDAEAETNRLWCELFHRTLNQSKRARRSRPRSRTPRT